MALELRISTGSTTPIYRQIADQIRHAIAVGAMRPGDRVPSVRDLAERLVVNPNTVARAFDELKRDGLVESRRGRGNFVADRRQVYSRAERLRRLDLALDAFLGETLTLDFSVEEIKSALGKKLSRVDRARSHRKGKSDG